jgi:hypothetical protein
MNHSLKRSLPMISWPSSRLSERRLCSEKKSWRYVRIRGTKNDADDVWREYVAG